MKVGDLVEVTDGYMEEFGAVLGARGTVVEIIEEAGRRDRAYVRIPGNTKGHDGRGAIWGSLEAVTVALECLRVVEVV